MRNKKNTNEPTVQGNWFKRRLVGLSPLTVVGTKENGKPKYKFNIKHTIKLILVLFIMTVLIFGIYAAVIISQAPKIDTGKIYSILSESSVIYDDGGNAVDKICSGENRTNIKYDDLPENLVNAFVALEDKTFWDHHGFNFIRIIGAIKDKIVSGGAVSGTSTITQQLARNLFLKESMYDHSMKRKIIEAYYTTILESELTKKQIMEAYLNTIYLGYNSNGVQAASQSYFNKDVKDLTLEQCVALASLPQAPSDYELVEIVNSSTPIVNQDNILKDTPTATYVLNDAGKPRRDLCLKLMLDQKLITKEQYDAAIAVSLKDMLNPQYNNEQTTSSYFTDYVIEQVIADLRAENGWDYNTAWEKVYKGGLKIYSTQDSTAQNVIEEEFSNDGNFPNPTDIKYDDQDNIVNSSGQVILYDYRDAFDSEKTFTLGTDEVTANKDGSLTINAGKRLNIYETEVNGKVDYSIEFKNMYVFENSKLYSISGGYINIPAKYKSKDTNGNIVISAAFKKDYPEFFTRNDDGTVSIPSSSYTLRQKVIQPQAAMTIVDNATGEIKAMVGGRKTTGKQLYNRAINPRQPGSSIKPLAVYSAALQQSAEETAAGKAHDFKNFKIDQQGTNLWGDHITAGSIVVDEKTVINGKAWPQNSNNSYTGPQTLRTALQQSINTCAVKIFMQVGTEYSADLVKKYGISTLVTDGDRNDLNAAALALGGMTNGVSSLEMASAYTVYPNNGTRRATTSYTKVVDQTGKTILTKEDGKESEVLNPGVAWIMSDILKSVVTHGLGSPASISGVQVGGKTGTTSDQYDIWFDGFTPTYSASLWVGNDINIELSGMSSYAARLWGKIMNQIPKAKSGSYKDAPSNVVQKGGEYYISGTESGLVSRDELSKTVTICADTGYLATPDCLNKEEKTYSLYGDNAESPPEYYCNLHNSDPVNYPIDPHESLLTDPGNSADPNAGAGTGNGH